MSTPFAQKLQIAKYIFGKKLKGENKYPLVMELEPLFQCNLACAGYCAILRNFVELK